MKKSILVMSIICSGMIAASGNVEAQTQGSQKMMHGSAQQQSDSQSQNNHSNMERGMMGGMGMGSGMMGDMGMGSGMTGEMGMMGGKSPMMQNFGSVEDFETFLEETKEQRRKLHTMRFEYMEKMRQPETTIGELKQMKKDINNLMKEIHGKAEKYASQ